jgi:ketosteroid isomerase-like protein
MSQENLEAIRRVYEQMAQGNFWAAREVFHPEIAWEWSSSMSGLTGVDTYHGIDGVEAATRDQFEVWDWFWQEGERFIEAGDEVVVLTRLHGRLKGSEREVQSQGADVWTFRGSNAIRFRSYDTRAEALEAVGLSEQDAHADS